MKYKHFLPAVQNFSADPKFSALLTEPEGSSTSFVSVVTESCYDRTIQLPSRPALSVIVLVHFDKAKRAEQLTSNVQYKRHTGNLRHFIFSLLTLLLSYRELTMFLDIIFGDKWPRGIPCCVMVPSSIRFQTTRFTNLRLCVARRSINVKFFFIYIIIHIILSNSLIRTISKRINFILFGSCDLIIFSKITIINLITH
jgi:hypothetical protein